MDSGSSGKADISVPKTYLLMVFGLSCGVLNHLIFLLIFRHYGVAPLYYLNYFSVVLFATLLFLLVRKKMVLTAVTGASFELIIHQVAAVTLLGWGYGFQYYLLVPPGFILHGEFRTKIIPLSISITSYAVLVALYFYSLHSSPEFSMPEVAPGIYIYNLISSAILLALFGGIFASKALKSERALLETQQKLSTDIAERVRVEEQLLALMQQIEGKERAKTRFLAAAGHDLRQPVAAATLFVDALKMSPVSQHQGVLIEKLDESMKAFSELLEQLLDISKFDAGLIKPQFNAVELSGLFNWLEDNFRLAAQNKNLELRCRFAADRSLIVHTDIGLLKSALLNLVSNAIKFTAHGGVLVSARVRENSVMFQVWDTGIGIDEQSLPHIFDEFYQVSNRQRKRDAGLGLGLSICRRSLTVLGSDVTCRSILGRGSVFSFSLPLEGNSHAAARTSPDTNAFAPVEHERLVRDKRVVVLEDDDLVASGLVSLLRELGAIVQHFDNAEEALRHPDIGGADYFIADFSLAGALTGLEFLRTVHQRHGKPIRGVLVSGETSSQFMKHVVDSAWPVLHKPVNFRKLASCLQA